MFRQHPNEITEPRVILKERFLWLLQQYGAIETYRHHHQQYHPELLAEWIWTRLHRTPNMKS